MAKKHLSQLFDQNALIAVLVLSVLVGIWQQSWAYPASFLLVLILHEGGHYLALRLLGYEDDSVYLYPWFNYRRAPTLHRATLAQQLIVAFAGPLPGLLIGMGVGAFLFNGGKLGGLLTSGVHGDASFLADFLFHLFFFNMATMLPLPSLDGGRIAHLVLGRHSLWALVLVLPLASIVIVAFMLYGWLLLVLGYCVFHALRHQASIWPQFEAPHARARSTSTARWLGGLVYVGIILGPEYGPIIAMELKQPFVADWREYHAERSKLETALAQAKTADERITLNLALVDCMDKYRERHGYNEPIEAAYADISRANFDSLPANRARIRYADQLLGRHYDQAALVLGQAEASLKQYHPEDTADLAGVYEVRESWLNARGTDSARIANLQALLALGPGAQGVYGELADRMTLADLQWSSRQPQAAIAALQTNFAKARALSPKQLDEAGDLSGKTQMRLGWALITAHQGAQALAVLQDTTLKAHVYLQERGGPDDPYDGTLPQAVAFAKLDSGDSQGAVADFMTQLDAQQRGDQPYFDFDELSMRLDLLYAETLAHRDADAAEQKRQVQALIAKDPSSLSGLQNGLKQESGADSYSTPRAQAEMQMLVSLGYGSASASPTDGLRGFAEKL